MNNAKLYRSNTDKMIAGVCGGLGDYFSIDSTILRLLFAFIVVFTGFVPGVIVYIIAALVMPMPPQVSSAAAQEATPKTE